LRKVIQWNLKRTKSEFRIESNRTEINRINSILSHRIGSNLFLNYFLGKLFEVGLVDRFHKPVAKAVSNRFYLRTSNLKPVYSKSK